MNTYRLDCLVIVAHPDDAEMGAGGTLALAARMGKRCGVVDLTRGEMATRGTPEIRAEESAKASEILGLTHRENLNLGDSDLANTQERRTAVVGAIRRLRPRLVITNGVDERHPDHRRAHELVRDSVFLANVGGFAPQMGERWLVEAVAWAPIPSMKGELPADWIVDVSEAWPTKIAAIQCYASQVTSAPNDPKPTLISSPGFWDLFERRGRLWGQRIGAMYGEPFILHSPPHAKHPIVELLN
ncbi:bacillithiol biosynthesis deacetylase BshB1 [bacterium]|nr:bacillithiol biosynthesis deacetylase BshB1 [bacterium]